MHEEYGELDSDYVFVNLWGGRVGQPMSYATVDDLVRRTRARVGFHFTPHMFRHTYASMARAGGVPLEVVSKILTHRSLQTTAAIYTHTTAEELRGELSGPGGCRSWPGDRRSRWSSRASRPVLGKRGWLARSGRSSPLSGTSRAQSSVLFGKRKCAVAGCMLPTHRSLLFCGGHDRQWRRRGGGRAADEWAVLGPEAGGATEMRGRAPAGEVHSRGLSRSARSAVSRRLCGAHYERWRVRPARACRLGRSSRQRRRPRRHRGRVAMLSRHRL